MEILKNENDINGIYDFCYKTVSEIVDRHAPLTKVAIKERTLQSKPWINKEINHLMGKKMNCSKNILSTRMKLKQLISEEFEKLRNNVTFLTPA